MQQAESVALRRAAVVLLLVSGLRWAWTERSEQSADAVEGDVLPELFEATGKATSERARRTEPLAPGEKIDPNRASEVELDRLPGIGPVTARAIVAAREEGVVFARPEDLLAVRGIGTATLERIRASLDFSAPPSARGPLRPGAAPQPMRSGARPLAEPPAPLLDVNRASAEELEQLPGIGPQLAARIVEARRERMFGSLEDLARVRGIGPATVERLRPYATAGRPR
jgi:competence protein ComEA